MGENKMLLLIKELSDYLSELDDKRRFTTDEYTVIQDYIDNLQEEAKVI